MVCDWCFPAIMKWWNDKMREVLNDVSTRLTTTGQTVATAESVTSGLVQWLLSSVPDVSRFFQGGITAYNLAQKYRHLDVEPVRAAKVDCVSREVAGEMAAHCCGFFNSCWALAITGYATPVEASGNRVYAWWAIAREGNVLADGMLTPESGDPHAIQWEFANQLVTIFGHTLEQASSSGVAREPHSTHNQSS